VDPVLSFLQRRCTDGYVIAVVKEPPARPRSAAEILLAPDDHFIPLSDRFETFDVFKVERPYLQFASIRDPKTALRFLNAFGYPLAVEDSSKLNIAEVVRSAANMRAAIDQARSSDTKSFLDAFNAIKRGNAHVELRLRDGAYALTIVPNSLLQGMWIQFAQDLTAGANLHVCQHCKNVFVAGASGRRGDAKFCSETCRKANHYRAKRVTRK